MPQEDYSKIYEAYLKSKQRLINELHPMVNMDGGPEAEAAHDIAEIEHEEPINHGEPIDVEIKTVGVPSVDMEKERYMSLIREIESFLQRAQNLTKQEITNVMATLFKAQFTA
jgi:hypothetical protein